jgi:hypothetical protein
MIILISQFINQAVTSQPIINHLSDTLPDCELLRTHCTNCIPEVDPMTLVLAAAAAAPTAKHTVVVTASLTITNMIALENGTSVTWV